MTVYIITNTKKELGKIFFRIKGVSEKVTNTLVKKNTIVFIKDSWNDTNNDMPMSDKLASIDKNIEMCHIQAKKYSNDIALCLSLLSLSDLYKDNKNIMQQDETFQEVDILSLKFIMDGMQKSIVQYEKSGKKLPGPMIIGTMPLQARVGVYPFLSRGDTMIKIGYVDTDSLFDSRDFHKISGSILNLLEAIAEKNAMSDTMSITTSLFSGKHTNRLTLHIYGPDVNPPEMMNIFLDNKIAFDTLTHIGSMLPQKVKMVSFDSFDPVDGLVEMHIELPKKWHRIDGYTVLPGGYMQLMNNLDIVHPG